MNQRKFLITGGTGFIGSYLAQALIRRDIPSVLLDAFVQYFSYLDRDAMLYQRYLYERFNNLSGLVTLVRADTRNKDDLRRAILQYRPTHVIHLGALPIASLSNTFSEEAVTSILTGTVNLLEIVRDVDFIQRFVYVSSSMVYGDFQYTPADEDHPKNPKNVYGGAKLCGEIMTQVFGQRFDVEYTIVRPSAVYGPTDVNRRVSQIFVENALRGEPLSLKGGANTTLDFTYVKDVAEGLVLAALEPQGRNEVFNITRGEGQTLSEFVRLLSQMIPDIQVVEEPAEASQPQRGALDISKACRLLGYQPQYNLENGLQEYVVFIQKCMREI